MTTHKAELHCAYQWDCDNCGGENFERAIVAELTDEDREHLTETYGPDQQNWQTGYWMTRPDEVKCQHCGAEYEVETGEEEDE